MINPIQKAINSILNIQSTAITVTLPGLPAVGSLLVTTVSIDKDGGTVTVPTGFSSLTVSKSGIGITTAFAHKIADGTESDITWTWSNSQGDIEAWVAEYSADNIPSGILDVAIISADSADLAVQSLNTGVTATTTQNDTFALAIFGVDTGGNYSTGLAISDGFVFEDVLDVGGTMLAVAGKQLAATGTYTTTLSTTGVGDQTSSILVVYQALPSAAILTTDFYISQQGVTTAQIKSRIPSGEAVSLEYDTDPLFATSITTAAITPLSADDFIVAFDLTGLSANTLYHYRVVTGTANSSAVGEFKTSGLAGVAQNISFAFASCGNTGNDAITYQNITNSGVDFLVHTGDLHYADIGVNTESLFWDAFKTQFGMTRFNAMFRKLPVYYMWDDHDYGPNNSDGGSASKTASAAAHRRYFPTEHPLNNPSAGSIERAWTIGRVRFILLDPRYERSVGTTMLGATQKAWFKTELTNAALDSNIKLIVVSTGAPWISSADDDTWFGFTAERTEIADHIFAESLENNIVFIAGDAHMVAFDDGTNNTFDTSAQAGWPVFQSAPFGQAGSLKGGPYSGGSVLGDVDGLYSIMNITDSGNALSVNVKAYDKNNAVIQDNTAAIFIAAATIISDVIKNDSGQVQASQSGWIANVYNKTTGALVLRVTGLSTDAFGQLTFTDVALTAGTTYRVDLDNGLTLYGNKEYAAT